MPCVKLILVGYLSAKKSLMHSMLSFRSKGEILRKWFRMTLLKFNFSLVRIKTN